MDPDCPKEKASQLDWGKKSINEQIDLMKARPKTQSPFFLMVKVHLNYKGLTFKIVKHDCP